MCVCPQKKKKKNLSKLLTPRLHRPDYTPLCVLTSVFSPYHSHFIQGLQTRFYHAPARQQLLRAKVLPNRALTGAQSTAEKLVKTQQLTHLEVMNERAGQML